MLLKKGIIKKKIEKNCFETLTEEGKLHIVTFPTKFLMNFMNISVGDEIFFLIQSEDEIIGSMATKHDFMKYPKIAAQKNEL